MSKIWMKVYVDLSLDPGGTTKFYASPGSVIYWGDGTSDVAPSYFYGGVTHTYSDTSGQYVIEVDGENATPSGGYYSAGIACDGTVAFSKTVTKVEILDVGISPIKIQARNNMNAAGFLGWDNSHFTEFHVYAPNVVIGDTGTVDEYQSTVTPSFLSLTKYAFDKVTLNSTTQILNHGITAKQINDLYFIGMQAQWSELLNNIGAGNDCIKNAASIHFTVTYSYDTAGGTLQSGFDNPNTAASFPSPMPTCTKTGWTFAGWYKDPTFNTPVVAGTAIDVTTIYAKFAAAVTYSLNGGTNNALNPAAYTPTDVANARPLFAATKAGYDFAGWYTDSAFTNKVTNFGGFTGAAVTLYAKFEAQEKYAFKIKTGANAAAEKKLDAYTVRGRDGYVNENLSSLNNMGELLATVTEINARNEHALFDASAFITGAYVCLIKMTESVTTHLCEIHDLINNRVYLNDDGYALTDDIEDYIAACSVKTSYENIGVPSGMTMGELRTFINGVNSRGDHCFFDFSGYLDNAYVCTVLAYAQSAINYIFIFDILNGKVYGSYTGYTDATTVANYLSGNESDIVHAIKLTDANMTLSDMAVLLNKVNQLGHHILFDVSAIASGKYLVSCTASVSGSNVTISLFDIVSSKVLKAKSYTGTTKLTVALAAMVDITTSSELASGLAGKADAISGASALSLPYTAADGTSGTFTIYGKITPNS